MKTVKVTIQGTSPLLIHAPDVEKMSANTKGRRTNVILRGRDEALSALYVNDKGLLYVPNTWIKGTMINISGLFKVRKRSAKSLIAGSVDIVQGKNDQLIFDKKFKPEDIDVDTRTVVIQKARVVKSRAKLNDWSLSFDLNYDEVELDAPVIENMLVEAGKKVGIGDFRPQKSGPFGKFEVVKFEELA